MSATDIRASLGMPASSTTALLRSLVELGYLHYDSRSRTYMPTLRVGLLGDWMHGQSHAGRQLCAMVENLSHITGQLTVLGTRCNLQAQYIHVVRAHAANRPLKRGTLAPLPRTAVGWMLLSGMPDQEVMKLCTRINTMEQPVHRVSPSWLIDQIHGVREQGYAYCFGRVTPNVGAISMAVPTSHGRPPVVVAVSGTGAPFQERADEFIHTMREFCQRYTRDVAAASATASNRVQLT